ncbi:rRNA maturation endonuclease Nob1 [Anaerosolibacter carboniphilus]|uniref:rRNA maturation endonuclease Nob1 n=1 Tax=Anaerosolibacter carboniphilus TaxID=1417629 RepID=A0A841KRA6_9FIRM|nr:hypothetical protein [Anaerosolibacter carboniphilus]MBB6216046.1 rRNA maturation endonuclease Nob1 [Anaerosolibacter carboniphilus]
MKKKIGISIICLVLVALIIYIGTMYHPLQNGVCGSEVLALRTVGIIIGIMILGSVLLDFKRSMMYKTLCLGCAAEMEEDWVMCPYCGLERRGDDLR